MSYPVTRRRFTVAEYHQMAEAGIITNAERVELIDGEVVEMSAINARHAAGVRRVTKLLERQLGDSYLVSVQNPVQLTDYSELQPDIAVIKSRDDFYLHLHPTPADTLLIVEIAESSSVRDRIVKMPEYAKAKIAELWIVDLQGDLIEVYADPAGDAYQSVRQARRGEALSPRLLPSVVLQSDELLG